jgi:hypothetical protein
LDEGDDEGALGEKDAGYPLDGYRLIGEPDLEVGFCDQSGGVEFFEGLGDAFGLRARETPLLVFLLTMPFGVDGHSVWIDA